MEAAKNAKEAAANVAASAACAVEKTKATAEEKVCLFFIFWFFRQYVERYSFYCNNGIYDMWLSRWNWGKPMTQRRKKRPPERKRRE
jgi:hypothetical protein